jgi:ribosomal protein S18 acetylase RimI-like enzyme
MAGDRSSSGNGAGSAGISPLTPNDLDAVIAIDRKWSGASRRGFYDKRLAAALVAPHDFVHVGLRDGETLIGFAMARLLEGGFGRTGPGAALDAIGVDPEHAGGGAGRRMLAALEAVLVHKGARELLSQAHWTHRKLLAFFDAAGFRLSPRIMLDRDTATLLPEPPSPEDREEPGGQSAEIDHSSPGGDDFSALARDRFPVRSMREEDLAALIAIDRKATGHDRQAYYGRKMREALTESGVRVSLSAESDGAIVGFIMARVDFGEFGRTEAEAVMDTIGVAPDFRGQGIGTALMSQLLANLAILRVERVRTELDWNDFRLIAYLDECGFQPSQRLVLRRAIGG